MKKIISLLLVMILLCTGCAGGKTSGEEEVEGGKDKKDGIRLYVLSMDMEHLESFQNNIIEKFERIHPRQKVYLEIGVTEENGITIADAIRNLNVEMMAGNGPDVLFLDGLPIHEYIEKGMLEDMSGLLRELKNNGNVFFEKVLTAYEENGKICAMPTTFAIPIVMGDEEAVQQETIHDFAKLAEQRADNPIPVFDKMWISYLPKIFRVGWKDVVNDSQMVDKEALKELLNDMKKLAKVSGFDKDLVYPQAFELNPLYGSSGEYYMDFLTARVAQGNIQMTTAVMDYDYEFRYLQSEIKTGGITYGYLNRKSGNPFFPKQIIGINALSEKKKESEDFVRYLISTEFLQEKFGNMYFGITTCGMYGILVNKGNLEIEMKDMAKAKTLVESENPQEQEPIYTDAMTPSDITEIFQFLDKADTMVDMDYMLYQSIMDLVENYIFERETLESTVEEIANKVELYQAE